MIRAAFVLALALVAASCSSGMSPADYASAMEAHVDAYVTESQDLSFDYQRGVIDEVRRVVAADGANPETEAAAIMRRGTIEYLALLSDAIDRYLAALRELSPPGSVSEAHAEYIAAIQASRDAIPATRDAVEAASDLAELQLALTASGFADSQLRWTAACTSLEQAVRGAGRGLNLRCTRSTVGVGP